MNATDRTPLSIQRPTNSFTSSCSRRGSRTSRFSLMERTISTLRWSDTGSDFRQFAMEIGMPTNLYLRDKTLNIFVFKYIQQRGATDSKIVAPSLRRLVESMLNLTRWTKSKSLLFRSSVMRRIWLLELRGGLHIARQSATWRRRALRVVSGWRASLCGDTSHDFHHTQMCQ